MHYCGWDEEGKRKCLHKPIWPMHSAEWWGLVFIAVSVLFSVAAGVGGGGILVPILQIMFDFPAWQAVPLSQTIILFSSVISQVMDMEAKDARGNSLVDYRLAGLLQPLLCAGSSLGMLLNFWIPDLAIFVSQTILLILVSIRTGQRMVKERNAYQDPPKPLNFEQTPLIDPSPQNKENSQNQGAIQDPENKSGANLNVNKENISHELSAISKKDESSITKIEENKQKDDMIVSSIDITGTKPDDQQEVNAVLVLSMLVPLVMMVTQCLLRGSPKMDSVLGIEQCDITSWALMAAMITIDVILVVFVVVDQVSFAKKSNKQFEVSIKDLEEEIDSSEAEKAAQATSKVAGDSSLLVFLSLLVGVISGAVGLSGGMFVMPMFLEMKLEPMTASATSNLIVLLSSMTTFIQQFIGAYVEIKYAFMFAMTSIVCGVMGKKILMDYIRKYNMTFLIVMSLFIVSVVSTIGIFVYSIFYSVQKISEGKSIGNFKNFCD